MQNIPRYMRRWKGLLKHTKRRRIIKISPTDRLPENNLYIVVHMLRLIIHPISRFNFQILWKMQDLKLGVPLYKMRRSMNSRKKERNRSKFLQKLLNKQSKIIRMVIEVRIESIFHLPIKSKNTVEWIDF